MQQGFDFCYDKKLYDRLLAQDAAAVRSHLWADLAYQNKLARFLENHDEPRVAHDFPQPVHQAAAVLTYFTPGLRFFHEGQFEAAASKSLCTWAAIPRSRLIQSCRGFTATSWLA